MQPADLTWTIRCDDTYAITVGRVGEGPGASFGYVVRESDKCAPCAPVACRLLSHPGSARCSEETNKRIWQQKVGM